MNSPHHLILVTVVIALFSHESRGADSPPPVPFELEAPFEPSRMWDETDISGVPPTGLRGAARRLAYEEHAYLSAAQLQHWAVAGEPAVGLYTLAAYYSLAGNLNASLYWLQRAAQEEGVLTDRARRDPDLAALVADERWDRLAQFLKAMEAWWAAESRVHDILLLPTGFVRGQSIDAVVMLHGAYGRPEEFADPTATQPLADHLGVAIVAPSGTVRCGPDSYRWSEDGERDRGRVAAALAALEREMGASPRRLVTLGFTQSAFLAVDLASRDPARHAGAIALSPLAGGWDALEVSALEGTAPPVCLLIWGAHQQRVDLEATASMAEALTAAGLPSVSRQLPDRGVTLPMGFEDNLPIWIGLILAR